MTCGRAAVIRDLTGLPLAAVPHGQQANAHQPIEIGERRAMVRVVKSLQAANCMGLGAAGRGPAGYVKADIDLDQSALEVDVGYEVVERLVVLAGLRYNDLSVDIEATGPLGTRKASQGESWLGPVIGATYTIPFADRWSFTLPGDIGRFGVGSDFAGQGLGTLRWRASERTSVLAAYRCASRFFPSGSRSACRAM
jgi:hypothetical protein